MVFLYQEFRILMNLIIFKPGIGNFSGMKNVILGIKGFFRHGPLGWPIGPDMSHGDFYPKGEGLFRYGDLDFW